MKKLPSGFTLIELMIVVTIIGILAILGTYGYTSALKITRDAKRQADLKVIQSAIEQYHNDQHVYPPTPITFSAGDNFAGPDGRIYLNNVPVDPTAQNPSTKYRYQPFVVSGGADCTTPPCKSYCLYAVMEISSSYFDAPLCPSKGSYNFEVPPP